MHRDIKPANLLLDVQGNLWITDFGLARLQDDAGLTITGDLLGTLRYMSPEQALAKRGYLDHRTDIYSLGATLYELVTLRPAIDGQDRQEVLRKIAQDEPTPLRRINPAIPRELETILLKAMNKEPVSRYATAQEMADDLRRFMEHKPIKARRPSLVERAAKWSRRHRMAVTTAFVFLLLAVVTLAASTILIARQQREVEKQRDLAYRQRQHARQAVDGMYTRVAEEWIANQPQLEHLQREFLLEALRFYQGFSQEDANEPTELKGKALAYLRVGDVQRKLGQKDEAEEAYLRALKLFEDLATNFPTLAEHRAELSVTHHSRGTLFLATGRLEESEQALRRALTIREGLWTEFPTILDYGAQLAETQIAVGVLFRTRSQFKDAEEMHRRAEEIGRYLVVHQPRSAAYRCSLAKTLTSLGVLMDMDQSRRLDEAESCHREAIKMLEALVNESPRAFRDRQNLMVALNNLGTLLVNLDKYAESEQFLVNGRQLARHLEAEFPNMPESKASLAQLSSNLGIVFKETGRLVDAEQAHREALVERRKLLDSQPGVPRYHSDVGASLNNLANVLQEQGKLLEARPLVEEAIRHKKAALKINPRDPTYRHHLSNSFSILTNILVRSGDVVAATQVEEEWAGLFRVAGSVSGTSDSATGQPSDLNKLARVLATSPYPQLRDSRLAVRLAKKAVEQAPESWECCNTLGMANYRAGDWKAAVVALEKSLELRADDDPSIWFFLTMAHWKKGEKDHARKWYDKAVNWMEEKRSQDDELRRFRDEAAALLGVTEHPKSTGQKEKDTQRRLQP